MQIPALCFETFFPHDFTNQGGTQANVKTIFFWRKVRQKEENKTSFAPKEIQVAPKTQVLFHSGSLHPQSRHSAFTSNSCFTKYFTE